MSAKLRRVHCDLQSESRVFGPRMYERERRGAPVQRRSDWESSLVSLEFEGHPVGLAKDLEHALDLGYCRPCGLDDGVQSDRDGASCAFRPIRHGQSCDQPLQLRSEVHDEMLCGGSEDIERDVQISCNDLAGRGVSPRGVTYGSTPDQEAEVAESA